MERPRAAALEEESQDGRADEPTGSEWAHLIDSARNTPLHSMKTKTPGSNEVPTESLATSSVRSGARQAPSGRRPKRKKERKEQKK
jgi:hypothetical protein